MLEVQDLDVTFPGASGDAKAVDNLSLTIDEGEIVAIVGESGSGKSTLGLSIPGLLGDFSGAEVQGRISFHGVDLLGLSEKSMRGYRGQKIAMIFQNARAALNPSRTVGSLLIETIRHSPGKMSREDAQARAVELLDLVGIPDPTSRLRSYAHQLSGGMSQRIMIALAVASDVRVLIADEPTSALDLTVKVQILELLKKLRDELGTAILIITHDLSAVRAIADKVCVMYAGEIVEMGDVKSVLEEPKMPYTQALVRALPQLSQARSERLAAIPGRPPSLVDPPSGCRFQPRCQHATDLCNSKPELLPITSAQSARCLFPHDEELQNQRYGTPGGVPAGGGGESSAGI